MNFGGYNDRIRRCNKAIFCDSFTDLPKGDLRCQGLAMKNYWLNLAVINVDYSKKIWARGQSECKDIRSTLRQPRNKARMYPSIVLSPTCWCPTRYVLWEEEMKYSARGRVISCQVSFCWSRTAGLSDDRRKAVNASSGMRAQCPEKPLEYLLNKVLSSLRDNGDCEAWSIWYLIKEIKCTNHLLFYHEIFKNTKIDTVLTTWLQLLV